MNRQALFLLGIFLGWATLHGQPLNLDQCIQAALDKSPIQQKIPLQETISDLENDRLHSNWYPRLSLNAQSTYQSDVITFPDIGPGSAFPEIPQFQYRGTIDLKQPIYEGGKIRQNKILNEIDRKSRVQELEIDLYQVQKQVTRLYFGILQLNQQISIVDSSIAYLEKRKESIETAVEQGILLSGSLFEFERELLSLSQQKASLNGKMEGQIASLEELTGMRSLDAQTLGLPEADQSLDAGKRPEHQLFDLTQQSLHATSEAVKNQQKPVLSAFGSAGVGQPNPYNFLEVDIDGFYIVGLSLSWAPWDWKQTQRKKEQLAIQQEMVELTKEQFDLQLNSKLAAYDQQIASYQSILERDETIVGLQDKIVSQAEVQVDNGTMTTADFLKEIQTLTRVRMENEMHKLQLLQLHMERQWEAGQ